MLLNCVLAASLVAVFDDAVPGQDREANREVVAALEARGFQVERLDVAGMANLSRDRYAALVVPSCEAVPRSVAASALAFVPSGGPAVFTGGPMLDKEVFRRDGSWYTREMVEDELARAPIGFRPPCLSDKFNAQGWHRVHNGRAPEGSFFRREGDCLHLSTVPLMGWDVFHSPRGMRFFGDGETMFAVTAKADETNTVLSVAFVESDGSRDGADRRGLDARDVVARRFPPLARFEREGTRRPRRPFQPRARGRHRLGLLSVAYAGDGRTRRIRPLPRLRFLPRSLCGCGRRD